MAAVRERTFCPGIVYEKIGQKRGKEVDNDKIIVHTSAVNNILCSTYLTGRELLDFEDRIKKI